ncbi:Transcriptional regulator [Pleurostoma richardsiae]|uniref:Transcriptional regulator n=1 Tax=Pleurostoma richardsiae TaxID=41990 RepID=A0AA38RC51_9PEZI|nr:Transcriptional regulator [Pleurostoma richardsiae]
MATVVLLGTCDTKLKELLFLREQILGHQHLDGVAVTLIDVGKLPIQHEAISIRQDELVLKYAIDGKSLSGLPRGEVIKFMSGCASRAVRDLYAAGNVQGIVAAGGTGGTSLAAAVMREALPIGLPKLIVSTVASGDTGPIVGETDIAMLYSVVDIAGLNEVLCEILSNAGAAIAAAASSYAERRKRQGSESMSLPSGERKRVGITMFGVTTPGVDAIRRHLETEYGVEAYVFHATGHGGKAMERLVREGRLDAVLDLTTTEVCDLITGGNMSAGPHRLEAAAEAGIPCIVSLGATDMSNFGPRQSVPEKYRSPGAGRLLYEHNPVVTLMRSSPEECRAVGKFICAKLREHAKRPGLVQVWIPVGGVSMISTPGGPFADADADEALFTAVTDGIKGSGIEVVVDPRDINDGGFAMDIADALAAKMGLRDSGVVR